MTQDHDLEIPQGLSNPWVFVQKKIIFEHKIKMVDSLLKYHRVYAREKENDALLFDLVVCMRQLYIEIKEIVKKNKKSKKECSKTISYMDGMIDDPIKEFTSEDFPILFIHYVKLMDMLVYIGLTDIEAKAENPHEAIINGSNS